MSVFDSSQYTLSVSGFYTGVSAQLLKGDDSEKYLGYYREYISELLKLSGDENPDNTSAYAAELCKAIALEKNAAADRASLAQTVEETTAASRKNLFRVECQKNSDRIGQSGQKHCCIRPKGDSRRRSNINRTKY